MNLITTSSGVAKSFICSLCVNRHTVRNKQFLWSAQIKSHMGYDGALRDWASITQHTIKRS